MKIYLLRHGMRKFEDHGFYSLLTPEGEKQAEELVETLEDLKINQIYSSPFIRALQTIKPYSEKSKISVKVEYGIYEDIEEPWFCPEEFQYTLTADEKEKYRVDETYESYFPMEGIKFNESFENVQARVDMFLNYLLIQHQNTTDNILLVTHMSVVNALLSTYEKREKESKFPQAGLIEMNSDHLKKKYYLDL